MRKLFSGVFVIFLIATPFSANAQTLQPLSLQEALKIAIANNAQLAATRARLGVSSAEITTSGARLNPVVLSDNGLAEKTYRLGVEQTIELGGKRKNRIAVARAQNEVVGTEVDIAVLDTRTNARHAYTQLYNIQARQDNAQNVLDTTAKLLDVARKRAKAGDISAVEVLQADIVTANAQNDLQTVAAQVVQAENALSTVLNQSLESRYRLEAPPMLSAQIIPTLKIQSGTLKGGISQTTAANLDQLIQTALTHRPEIQKALKNQEVASRQLVLAKANKVPNLTIAAGPDFVVGSGGGVSAFIMGNVSLPFLNRQQGAIAEAQARQIQYRHEQVAQAKQVILEVTNAYFVLNANQERLIRYEKDLLPKTEILVVKSRRSFEAGKVAILLPLNAQQAYTNTRLGYLQAIQDYQDSISNLERAIGAEL